MKRVGNLTSHPFLPDYRLAFLSGSLKKEADETLFLELALRGIDLSKLRDEPTAGEVVKIG